MRQIYRMLIPMLAATAWLTALGAEARAQSSGMFGSRSMGSSFSPSASGFGGTRSTAAGGMPSGFGGVGGMGGGVAGATTRGDATAGQITGSERYLRGARQPGQFVGGDSGDAANFFSQLSNYSATQSGRGRGNNDSNANRLSGMSGSGGAKTPPRIEQNVAFDFAPPRPELVDAALESRFALSPRFARLGTIAVRMEGRVAILSGAVATEHDRALAEQLALLEAGVSAVRNDLTIAPPGVVVPAPAPAPATKPADTAPPK